MKIKDWIKSKKCKDCEEMRSLIDGVYDIVFIYKAESPAQIKWREDWLKNARKFGASLDG